MHSVIYWSVSLDWPWSRRLGSSLFRAGGRRSFTVTEDVVASTIDAPLIGREFVPRQMDPCPEGESWRLKCAGLRPEGGELVIQSASKAELDADFGRTLIKATIEGQLLGPCRGKWLRQITGYPWSLGARPCETDRSM